MAIHKKHSMLPTKKQAVVLDLALAHNWDLDLDTYQLLKPSKNLTPMICGDLRTFSVILSF